MKRFGVLAVIAILSGSVAQAQTTLPRSDYMRTCADQWKARKAAPAVQKPRYQVFMSQCMKALASQPHAGTASQPAHAN